jgi:hypothetical protein
MISCHFIFRFLQRSYSFFNLGKRIPSFLGLSHSDLKIFLLVSLFVTKIIFTFKAKIRWPFKMKLKIGKHESTVHILFGRFG